jgi:hypothetical protein
MNESVFNALIQISGSVAGGAVGGFAGFIASLVQSRSVRREKRCNIASALIGEIGALTQLYRDQYVPHLTDLSNTLDATTSNAHPVRGEQEYMPIFRSLGSEIGHFPAPLPHDLVMWYTALTVALERAHALHDLTLQNHENGTAYIAKLAQDQIDHLPSLCRQSQDLIARLAAL